MSPLWYKLLLLPHVLAVLTFLAISGFIEDAWHHFVSLLRDWSETAQEFWRQLRRYWEAP